MILARRLGVDSLEIPVSGDQPLKVNGQVFSEACLFFLEAGLFLQSCGIRRDAEASEVRTKKDNQSVFWDKLDCAFLGVREVFLALGLDTSEAGLRKEEAAASEGCRGFQEKKRKDGT